MHYARGTPFRDPSITAARVLTAAHDGHPGIVRAKRQLRATYWWPGQDKDVEEFVRHCTACHDSAKAYKSTTVPPNNIPRSQEPWQKIALDICGPFAVAPRHQRFATVAIDYYSGFPEVLLSGDISFMRLIQWLTQLFARYGNPDSVVTDNGPQFVSNEFREFLRLRDIRQLTSAVYNPQQNGRVEMWNRFLKQGVQTFQGGNFEGGVQKLLKVCDCICNRAFFVLYERSLQKNSTALSLL